MKVYNLFNSRDELLCSFTDELEMARYIRRHSRDQTDTTILSTNANSWNETEDVLDVTKNIMENVWS